MDFAGLRAEAIEKAEQQLREPLRPDQVLLHAWRFTTGRPHALERWLFLIFPETHPATARDRVKKQGANAWNPTGRGANMDEQGWKALQQACKGKTPNINALAEHACKNLHALVGEDTAAQLIEAANGLPMLSRLTQRDCVQLGNTSGAFGGKERQTILQAHELGTGDRAIRVLASRVVLAARLDTYKGQFKGDALRQEVLYAQ